ncbi:hypothetical protein [Acetobacter persici]|uniref:hypothetical protein n=1 Tax=Acetobacter persici TaxID=1076596 RepID=UPI0039E7B6A0
MSFRALLGALVVSTVFTIPAFAEGAFQAPPGAVERLQWNAITVTASQFKPMHDLAASLGWYPAVDQKNFAVFVSPNGNLFEIYGPGSPRYAWQEGQGGTATGFLTTDLNVALANIKAHGGKLLGDVKVVPHAGVNGGDYGFQLFRAPDGRIYAIAQNANFHSSK